MPLILSVDAWNATQLGAAAGEQAPGRVPDPSADAEQAVAGHRAFVVDQKPLAVAGELVEADVDVEVGSRVVRTFVPLVSRGPAIGVEQDEGAGGVDEWIVEVRHRLEAHPLPDQRPRSLALRALARSAAADVAPEVEDRPAVPGPVKRRGCAGPGDVGCSELLVLVPRRLRRCPHHCLENRLVALAHPHRQRLRAATALEQLDAQLDLVEGGRAEEVAVEARRPRDLGAIAGGAQGEGSEVAAARAPDLPRIAEPDRVAAGIAF